MSFIEKQKGKRGTTYRVRWRDDQGRARSKNFKRRAEAQAFLTDIDQQRRDGSYVDPANGRMLINEWVPRWQASLRGRRISTSTRDEEYVARYILPQFGHQRLCDVTTENIDEWVDSLLKAKLAPATVVLAAHLLGAMFKSAVKRKRLKTSPYNDIELPAIERREMRFLLPEEVANLADAIDERYRAYVVLGAFSGLRPGELMGLRVRRFDPLRRTVEVAEIITEVNGSLYFGPPKTDAGRRIVPLPRVACDAVVEHIKMAGLGPDDYVFQSPNGGPVRLTNWRRRIFKPAVERAGLTPLRPHDLRHAAVAFWIEAGASALEVKRRAGHKSIAFTLDTYGHLFPGSEDRVNQALDELAVTPRAVEPPRILPLPRPSTAADEP